MAFSFGSPSVGLVIRNGTVELLALRAKQIVARATAAIEGEGAVSLSDAIRKALDTAGVTPKTVAVGVQTPDVLFRFFTIPVLPRHEWEATVRFEVRKYLPFKTDQLIWGAHVAASSALGVGASTTGKLEVIFAGMQRKAFEELGLALAELGIQATRIEPQSLSLARLVASRAKTVGASEFACLVEIEGETAHLAIVKGGIPYLTRDISLLTNGSGQPIDATPQGSPIDQRAQRLLSELGLSMDFFSREYPSATVSRVVLFGDEAMIEPWCEQLAGPLRCAVETGRAALTAHAGEDAPLACASAVGLLLTARDVTGGTLDFLKRSVVPAKRAAPSAQVAIGSIAEMARELQTGHIVAGILLAATLLAAVWFPGHQQIVAAQRQLDRAVGSRPKVEFGLEGMGQAALEPIQRVAGAQVALLRQVVEGRVLLAEKLDALVRSLPDGIWLTSLLFEDTRTEQGKDQFRITLRGACYLGELAQELGAIQSFEERLRNNPTFFKGFDTAHVGQINSVLTPQGRYAYRAFDLECHSERKL